MSVNTLACNSNISLLSKMANVQNPSQAGTLSTGKEKYAPLLTRMQQIQAKTTTGGSNKQVVVDPADDLFSSQRLVRNMVRSASKANMAATNNIQVATNDSYWSEDE